MNRQSRAFLCETPCLVSFLFTASLKKVLVRSKLIFSTQRANCSRCSRIFQLPNRHFVRLLYSFTELRRATPSASNAHFERSTMVRVFAWPYNLKALSRRRVASFLFLSLSLRENRVNCFFCTRGLRHYVDMDF